VTLFAHLTRVQQPSLFVHGGTLINANATKTQEESLTKETFVEKKTKLPKKSCVPNTIPLETVLNAVIGPWKEMRKVDSLSVTMKVVTNALFPAPLALIQSLQTTPNLVSRVEPVLKGSNHQTILKMVALKISIFKILSAIIVPIST